MKRILIIEDETYISNGLKFVFSKNGLSVIIAQNGYEALELLKDNTVDIIMTDLCMPEMDGFETAIKIRELPLYKEIPIIAYTGFIDKKYFDKAYESGINEVINKPLNPDLVLETLNKYFN